MNSHRFTCLSSLLLLAILSGICLAGCGGTAPSAPLPPKPAACPYENLSTWQGADGAWPTGMRFYLRYIEGCGGKDIGVSVATANPFDHVRLWRPLEAPPDTFVRLVATLDLLEGAGDLWIEVRDVGLQVSELAWQNPNGVAEIRLWLPTGHAEVALHAQALSGDAIMIATISDVLLETR